MNKKYLKTREWFEHYAKLIEEGKIKKPLFGHLYVCPCCGYLTLTELSGGGDETCFLCRWSNEDPKDDSLTEARENFHEYLVKDREGDSRFPHSKQIIQSQLKIIKLFDKMVNVQDPKILDDLWKKIDSLDEYL